VKASRISLLIPSVVDKLPATPLPGQVLRALRDAAQRFCFETECWKEPLPAVDLTANTLTYTISTTWQAEVKRIYAVTLRTAADIAANRPGRDHDFSRDSYDPSTGVYRFYSAPSAIAVTDGLIFTCVLVPNLQTNEVNEWITGLYGTAFIYGAVADMCSHKGAGPMYDPQTAALYTSKYNQVKNNVNAEVFRNHMNVSPTIHPAYNMASAALGMGSGYRVGG